MFEELDSRSICAFFGRCGGRAHTSEELATTAVFHTKVQVVLGLEGVIKGDDEWMVTRCQDFLFGKGALDLVALDHLLLA